MFHDPDKIPEGHDEAAIDILRSKGIFYALRESARNAVPEDVDSFPERYRQLSCPTLVIWGKEDRVVPALNALRLEADIPGARLHVFDECGHLPHLEYPHESAAVIRDWARYQL
jgi:pimeloyl-ACP methyl ester carboxylesterase